MNMQETKPISAYKQGLRSKIIETALKNFRARGIRAVTMDEVAAVVVVVVVLVITEDSVAASVVDDELTITGSVSDDELTVGAEFFILWSR